MRYETYRVGYIYIIACVRGSPMVPLVGNICTICTNLIANGTIGKDIGANGKNGNTIGTNDVTNQWYHWENPEHTRCHVRSEKGSYDKGPEGWANKQNSSLLYALICII